MGGPLYPVGAGLVPARFRATKAPAGDRRPAPTRSAFYNETVSGLDGRFYHQLPGFLQNEVRQRCGINSNDYMQEPANGWRLNKKSGRPDSDYPLYWGPANVWRLNKNGAAWFELSPSLGTGKWSKKY